MSENNVIASYNGSQLGFTIRDFGLEQESYSNINIDINGIAAGGHDDLYITSANNIYHYRKDGTLLNTMTFPDKGIIYNSIAVTQDRVYATYSGSQVGVTVRDLNLNQRSYFATNFVASGIAAGTHNDLYLTANNHIYRYKTDGTLLEDMEFPISTIEYTDVSVLGNRVYASYKGSQKGVTVRNVKLKQLSYFNTGIEFNSIAAGPDRNVYLASHNHIYNYSTSGNLIADMNFPIPSINYTSVSVVFTRLT